MELAAGAGRWRHQETGCCRSGELGLLETLKQARQAALRFLQPLAHGFAIAFHERRDIDQRQPAQLVQRDQVSRFIVERTHRLMQSVSVLLLLERRKLRGSVVQHGFRHGVGGHLTLTASSPARAGRHLATNLAQPQIDSLDLQELLFFAHDNEEHLLRDIIQIRGQHAEAAQIAPHPAFMDRIHGLQLLARRVSDHAPARCVVVLGDHAARPRAYHPARVPAS
jgi:hypothetical protein